MSNITDHITHFEKGLSALRLEVDASIVESLFILFEPIKAAIQSDNPNEASAIEIFKKHGAHYYEDDENDIINAMEEYHAQFKQPDISEDVKRNVEEYVEKWFNSVDKLAEDAASFSDNIKEEKPFYSISDKLIEFAKSDSVKKYWQSQQPIPTVDEDDEFELLLMIKNELLAADKLPFKERVKVAKEILEQFSITRK